MDENIVLMLLMFGVIIVFMILPQMKRAKKEKNFSEGLKRGDKVVTKGGLHGKIFDFSEKNNAVVLETGAGKLTFDRSSLSMDMSLRMAVPTEKK